MSKRAITAFALPAMLLVLLLPLTAGAQTASDPSATSSLLVKLVSGLSVDEQAAVIARNGGVETSSIPALRLHVVAVSTADQATILAAYRADPLVQSAEVNTTRQSETVPADPLYAYQWALPRIGWEQVFDTITPAGSATVALLDTGVDASHPELAGTVVPGISMLDGSDGRTDPSGHGTSLAGIIAAATDNIPMEGIAGVAYAGVQIMPVTVLDANGEGQDSDVIRGVLWAADHGADVILMAFSAPQFSQNLQDAIDYAWSKGVVVVAAAGNNASSAPTFPAGDRGVMGVAATDQSDAQAYFSNEGQAVFIAAPGVEIQTIDLDGNYVVLSGTSTAAAHVAGLAAFMKAVDPTLTNGVIVGRIARNADPAGTAEQTGNGRINMARALVDTSMEEVQPAGADPVGQGGPFVGPYRAAGSVAVSGTVKDSLNNPIPGATVSCTVGCNSAASTTTNAVGFYPPSGNFRPSFDGNGPAAITLTASATGFASASLTLSSVNNNTQHSAHFTLQPACTPPSITTQPSGATKTVGESVTFSLVTTGTAPLSYQWRKDDGNVGSDDDDFTISSVVVADTGAYTVVVSNACGEATSDQAILTVNKATPTIAWSTPADITYGTPLSATQLNATADVPGTFLYNPAADTVLGAGNGHTLHVDFTPTDTANYNNASNAVTINVTRKSVTASVTAASKDYDGGTTAEITSCTIPGKVGSDDVACTAAGPNTFDTAAAGTGKTVTARYISLTGSVAGNYELSATTAVTQADITAKVLTGSFTANDKEYDGTPTATVATKSLPGVISPDVVSLNVTNVLFDTKNVGNNKDVTGSLSLVGTDAGNYTVNSSHTAKASITPRGLTVSASGVNKVYDGTNAATVNLSTDKLNGDDVTAAYASASFADKNVGNGKAVSVSGISISGADAGNYNLLNTAANTTADITPKSITGSFTATDKAWDGTTAATVLTRSLNGAVGGDDVSLSGGTAAFNNANVGSNKPVTLTGATLAGTDAGNHTLSSVADATASILAWNAQGHGFYQPVGLANSTFVAAPGSAPLWSPATVWSVAKGGSSVPLKFNVYAGGVEKTSPSDIKEFKQVQLASCSDGAGEEVVENLPISGNTSLRYDTTDRQFIQNWKTPNVSKETCYRATVIFNDDSSLSAFFKLRK